MTYRLNIITGEALSCTHTHYDSEIHQRNISDTGLFKHPLYVQKLCGLGFWKVGMALFLQLTRTPRGALVLPMTVPWRALSYRVLHVKPDLFITMQHRHVTV